MSLTGTTTTTSLRAAPFIASTLGVPVTTTTPSTVAVPTETVTVAQGEYAEPIQSLIRDYRDIITRLDALARSRGMYTYLGSFLRQFIQQYVSVASAGIIFIPDDVKAASTELIQAFNTKNDYVHATVEQLGQAWDSSRTLIESVLSPSNQRTLLQQLLYVFIARAFSVLVEDMERQQHISLSQEAAQHARQHHAQIQQTWDRVSQRWQRLILDALQLYDSILQDSQNLIHVMNTSPWPVETLPDDMLLSTINSQFAILVDAIQQLQRIVTTTTAAGSSNVQMIQQLFPSALLSSESDVTTTLATIIPLPVARALLSAIRMGLNHGVSNILAPSVLQALTDAQAFLQPYVSSQSTTGSTTTAVETTTSFNELRSWANNLLTRLQYPNNTLAIYVLAHLLEFNLRFFNLDSATDAYRRLQQEAILPLHQSIAQFITRYALLIDRASAHLQQQQQQQQRLREQQQQQQQQPITHIPLIPIGGTITDEEGLFVLGMGPFVPTIPLAAAPATTTVPFAMEEEPLSPTQQQRLEQFALTAPEFYQPLPPTAFYSLVSATPQSLAAQYVESPQAIQPFPFLTALPISASLAARIRSTNINNAVIAWLHEYMIIPTHAITTGRIGTVGALRPFYDAVLNVIQWLLGGTTTSMAGIIRYPIRHALLPHVIDALQNEGTRIQERRQELLGTPFTVEALPSLRVLVDMIPTDSALSLLVKAHLARLYWQALYDAVGTLLPAERSLVIQPLVAQRGRETSQYIAQLEELLVHVFVQQR